DERSLASLTLSVRPWRSLPLNSAIAFCASLAELISTNPKPRDCPVARSVMTATDSHVPACENMASRSLLVVSKERLPTKIFLPISHSSPCVGGIRFCRGCLGEKPTAGRLRGRAQTRGRPLVAAIRGVVQPRDAGASSRRGAAARHCARGAVCGGRADFLAHRLLFSWSFGLRGEAAR